MSYDFNKRILFYDAYVGWVPCHAFFSLGIFKLGHVTKVYYGFH